MRFKLEEKLSDADRKYLATKPTGKLLQPFESVPPAKEVQELGPASDALVRLFARSDTAAKPRPASCFMPPATRRSSM